MEKNDFEKKIKTNLKFFIFQLENRIFQVKILLEKIDFSIEKMKISQKKKFFDFFKKNFHLEKKYCFFEKISYRSEIFQRFQKSHLENSTSNSTGCARIRVSKCTNTSFFLERPSFVIVRVDHVSNEFLGIPVFLMHIT